jgi:integrase
MTKRKRRGQRDYLYQRPGSRNWWIRLQSPNGDKAWSLKTPDRVQAEIKALRIIADHKAALLAARPHLVMRPHKLSPGEYTVEGARVIATEREIIYFKPDGALSRTEPNDPVQQLVNWPMGALITFGNPARPLAELRKLGPVIDISKLERPAPVTKGDDDEILETYLQHAKNGPVTGYDEREARAVWAIFRRLTNGKALKDCDRTDGRKLVEHFQNEGLKSATIEKKIAWLNAACNIAVRDGKLKLNPFAGIAPQWDDKLRRQPLSDDDMKVIKRNLGKLGDVEQLLIRLLASTGMRIAEAFEIDTESKERGVRFCIVGHKTAESRRRVPFPAAVLPYLPKTIGGPLFPRTNKDPADAASKRLNRFLDDIGIVDPAKVVHSLRHRAADRLRAVECPQDIRWALLGHEDQTVAKNYGKGFSVPQLKRWIDKIRF